MSNKVFASDVSFQLGLASLVADAVPIKRTGADGATSFKYICPSCDDPTPPAQKYICPACQGVYWPSELSRAKELEDGSLRKMADDELESINAEAMDCGIFAVQVCPAPELEAKTSPSGQAYRLRLAAGKKAKKGTQQKKAYALFRALAADPALALYGVARLNGRCNPTPFRLRVWRDQLLLEGLTRPQDLTDAETIEGDVDPAMLEMAQKLVQSLSTTFDQDSLADERAKKLADIVAQAPALAPLAAVPATSDDGPDLMALLAASLQAA